MNHLIAKIRSKEGKDEEKYKKLLSSRESIYNLPPATISYLPYNPATLLSEDGCFKIDNFSQLPYCIDFMKKPFNSVVYNQFSNDDFEQLNFLCSYQNNNEFHFQNITKTQLLNKRRLSFSGDCEIKENEKSIYIKNEADAIYLKDSDVLLFKNLSAITGIFRGISDLYREATEEETKEFLKNDLICLVNNFNVHNVNIPNRKRIALALKTLQSFENEDKENIFTYIHAYCPHLIVPEDTKSFQIGNEEELRSFLHGIEQHYYTTQIGQEKRLANSVIPLT